MYILTEYFCHISKKTDLVQRVKGGGGGLDVVQNAD